MRSFEFATELQYREFGLLSAVRSRSDGSDLVTLQCREFDIVFCYSTVNSIFYIYYSTAHLGESRPKWIVEIGCYRGLPVAEATAEEPDPSLT
jgi:hypothetical protein